MVAADDIGHLVLPPYLFTQLLDPRQIPERFNAPNHVAVRVFKERGADAYRLAIPSLIQNRDGPVHDGMHAECGHQFGLDLKEAFPDPIDILICPSDKFLPIAEYDWLEDIDAFINLCWSGENDGDNDHAL